MVLRACAVAGQNTRRIASKVYSGKGELASIATVLPHVVSLPKYTAWTESMKCNKVLAAMFNLLFLVILWDACSGEPGLQPWGLQRSSSC